MYIPASTVIRVLLELVCAMDFGDHVAGVHVQHFAIGDALLRRRTIEHHHGGIAQIKRTCCCLTILVDQQHSESHIALLLLGRIFIPLGMNGSFQPFNCTRRRRLLPFVSIIVAFCCKIVKFYCVFVAFL